MEYILSQQHIGRCNMTQLTTYLIDKNILRTNAQEKISIFNKIRHIKEVGNKLISLPKKPQTPDHIGDLINNPLRYECYDLIFTNDEKMAKSTIFSA